jgi:hypothetical protein
MHRDTWVAIAVFLCCVIVIGAVWIATSNKDSSNPFKPITSQNNLAPESSTNICPVQDYGNNTVVFLCSEMLYATTLSDYQGEHHLYASSAVEIPDPDTTNGDLGYLVTFIPMKEGT